MRIHAATIWGLLTITLLCASPRAGAQGETSTAAPSRPEQVNQLMDVAMRAKLAVASSYFETRAWPSSSDECEFVEPASIPGAISVGPGGVITVAWKSPEQLRNRFLVLVPYEIESGTIRWDCRVSSDFPRYALPEGCG